MLYDNNLSRASSYPDIHGDIAATLAASLGTLSVPTEADTVTLTLEALADAYRRYHGLDMGSIGAGASYTHKFGLGFAAPWVSAGVTAADATFGTSIRDGARVVATMTAGKRFDEAFDATLALFYDRRYARNDEPVVPGISGAVFDLRTKGVAATAGYALNDRLQLGAAIGVRRGDVVSTTQRSFNIFVNSTAIAADSAFGPDMFAYRLDGTTLNLAISLSYAFDAHSSLNATVGGERTSVADGLDYRSKSGTLSFAYRY
jgi:hypothetical protein